MKLKILIFLAVCTALNFGCRNLLSKYKSAVTVEVAAHSWWRHVLIEQLEKKTAEDWEDKVPKDAKILSKRQDIHHYDGKVRAEVPEERSRRVQCGVYSSGKPGHYSPKYCDEKYTTTVTKEIDDITKPVYATKVKYEYEVWTEKEAKDFTGYDKDISKAETVIVDGKTTRIKSSNDNFRIELKTPDGKTLTQSVTKEIWDKTIDGQKINCRIDLNKDLSECGF